MTRSAVGGERGAVGLVETPETRGQVLQSLQRGSPWVAFAVEDATQCGPNTLGGSTMSGPNGFKVSDLGGEPSEVDCKPAFREITIEWSKPKPWKRDEPAPVATVEKKPNYLYAISWDHHLAARRETIAYIGITSALDTRFNCHPKAEELVARKRSTFLSIGHVDFGRFRTSTNHTKQITEELEHLLIWALWQDLLNDRKMRCLPGYGSNGGDPWHISNIGHRFSGRMPREIVYPWMLVKPGRDRSRKASSI